MTTLTILIMILTGGLLALNLFAKSFVLCVAQIAGLSYIYSQLPQDNPFVLTIVIILIFFELGFMVTRVENY